MSKKLFIETLGCAMNTRDSEHMVAELNKMEPYEMTEDAAQADLILVNTCSVREKPVQKLFSELGKYRKKQKEGSKIGVCGCTASHLGKDIIKRAPYVNFVIGARNVSKITEVINVDKAVEIDINYDESEYAFGEYRNNTLKAFINISIGCDKSCTFCIVPKTRGDEISIPTELIIGEVKKAVEAGVKEVYLLGQNVNNYGRRFSSKHKKTDFTQLLRDVSEVEGVERIRFTSPHPFHMDDAFIAEFASNDTVCKSMHMPVQSGSTKVLKDMKRGYSREWFYDRVEKLRTMVPGVSISTDIIVGFPGESDEDFEDTMQMVRDIRFDQVFSFKYSPRPHTEAESFTNNVDEEVASARLKALQDLQGEILDELAAERLGKTEMVMFESLQDSGMIAGRTDNNILVRVDGSEELLGTFKKVKFIQTGRMSNVGEVL
jgi:tRNA-2-methylthio-N6-dimethylallyladenosine synthase